MPMPWILRTILAILRWLTGLKLVPVECLICPEDEVNS